MSMVGGGKRKGEKKNVAERKGAACRKKRRGGESEFLPFIVSRSRGKEKAERTLFFSRKNRGDRPQWQFFYLSFFSVIAGTGKGQNLLLSILEGGGREGEGKGSPFQSVNYRGGLTTLIRVGEGKDGVYQISALLFIVFSGEGGNLRFIRGGGGRKYDTP